MFAGQLRTTFWIALLLFVMPQSSFSAICHNMIAGLTALVETWKTYGDTEEKIKSKVTPLCHAHVAVILWQQLRDWHTDTQKAIYPNTLGQASTSTPWMGVVHTVSLQSLERASSYGSYRT
jgi:hypothetical protein